MGVLVATDFFIAEVWTQGGLVTYYVLFFMHLATRRVHIAGITLHPNEQWMTQVARNVTMADVGFLSSSRYLIHDRDSKFCESFRDTIEGVGVTPIRLPARSPDLNAFAERWVRSVKEECLSKLILFGENSLRHALKEYVAHHHHERNHQGKDNLLLFPEPAIAQTNGLEDEDVKELVETVISDSWSFQIYAPDPTRPQAPRPLVGSHRWPQPLRRWMRTPLLV